MSSLDVFFILQGIIPRSLTQFCLDLTDVGACHAHAGCPPSEMTEKQHPWRHAEFPPSDLTEKHGPWWLA